MIGKHVIYVDAHGVQHDALVTAEWGLQSPTQSLNVVYVVDDEAKHDQYGRQTDHDTSVPHESKQDAPGRFWREA